MAQESVKRVSHNTFVLPLPNDGKQMPCKLFNSLAEACYLHIPVAFQRMHILTINLSIIPFSIPCHRGQLFYHVEASYALCCQYLNKDAFMVVLTDVAKKVYNIYMGHHTWNFEATGLWSVIPNAIVVCYINSNGLFQAAGSNSQGFLTKRLVLLREIHPYT